MKKIILVLSLLIGLISLSSCQGKAQITIIDENGEEKVVEIFATENKETVQNVLDYVSLAKYDDITKATMTDSVRVDVGISEELAQLMGLSGANQFIAFYRSHLKISKDEGLDYEMSAEISLDEKNYLSATAGAIYNGKLENVVSDTALAYVDASVDYKTTGTSSSIHHKIAVNPMEFFSSVGGQLPEIPELPPLENGVEEEFSLADFYKQLPNSKIFVENVNNNKILLGIKISYKDIVEQLDLSDTDLMQLKKFINLENFIYISLEIEVKTGRITGMSFELKDASLLNFIVRNFISIEISPEIELITKFDVTLKNEIIYNDADIKILSSAEKSQYQSYSFGE